jgi:DNA-binding response OmpR family regulator
VEVAHNVSDALRKIEANHFDAVICDIMLPQLRGDELFRRAIEARPSLQNGFVFITGVPDDPAVNRFLSQTREPYLIKSFRIQSLIDCVKRRIWSV